MFLKEDRIRVSTRINTLTKTNPLFESLAPILHNTLHISTQMAMDQLENFYATRRLGEPPEYVRTSTMKRLPDDIQQRKDIIGSTEEKLINFLLLYKDHGVLSVTGPIGSGKTSLLQYVLFYLRKLCPSLGRIVPLYIDCLAFSSDDPSRREFAYEALCVAQRAANDQGKTHHVVVSTPALNKKHDSDQLGFVVLEVFHMKPSPRKKVVIRLFEVNGKRIEEISQKKTVVCFDE